MSTATSVKEPIIVPCHKLSQHCHDRFSTSRVWAGNGMRCQVRNIRDDSGARRDVFFPVSSDPKERLFQTAAGEVCWNGPTQCHLTAADFVDGKVPG
jgi:hypothetical protein